MRKNFAEIMKTAKIDIKNEYEKLFDLFFTPLDANGENCNSQYDILSNKFLSFPPYLRGICLSIDEFNKTHEFRFERNPKTFNIYNLISLSEYIKNLIRGYQACSNGYYIANDIYNNVGLSIGSTNPINFIDRYVDDVMEKIGYQQAEKDDFIIYVEKSPAAIAVAESEMIPKELSYKVISYNHYLMRGDLQRKKETIQQLAHILEGKRMDLHNANSALEADLFFIFNNFNIRHNNTNPECKGNYKPVIAKMRNAELEKWYDEAYQMCLLAFLTLEYEKRKGKLKEIRTKIENKEE